MRRLLTPRWLARHAFALALVGAFLALGRWQLARATSGNGLSWGYAFQWPLFAVFVVAFWYRIARADVRAHRGEPPPEAKSVPPPLRPRQPARVGAPAVGADADDPELAAYNRYLAWLAANPDRRPNEYPGEASQPQQGPEQPRMLNNPG